MITSNHRKLIYTFDGWSSSVTSLEQSPVLDIVGVGLNDGRIIIHNLRTNISLMTFRQENGPVTIISFRKGTFNQFMCAATSTSM